MSKSQRWNDLSDRSRKLILTAAAIESAFKVAALVDLWRRPSDQVRGSKAAWATTIVVVNSAGIVPLVYFRRGRRK